jgi:hypothetical protein
LIIRPRTVSADQASGLDGYSRDLEERKTSVDLIGRSQLIDRLMKFLDRLG